MGFKIIGTGSCTPEKILTNQQLTEMVDTSDEWIVSHTGIKERRIMNDDQTSLDLAQTAALRAIENAQISAEDLDLIICTTVRNDFFTPSLACLVQEAVGAHCPSFDINAACSGFVYALDVAMKYFTDEAYSRILILSYEGMSRMVDWQDRATCVLFGDGCGAAVLERSDAPVYSHISAKGNMKLLNIKNIPCEPPAIFMEGPSVFKFAVTSALRDIPKALESYGAQPEDVTHVLLHQANKRIIDAIIEKLTIPADRYRINIESHGNVSSACIPTLLDELSVDGQLHRGDLIVLCAFGGGLTAGTTVFRW